MNEIKLRMKIIWAVSMVAITVAVNTYPFHSTISSYLLIYLYLIPIVLFGRLYGLRSGLLNAATAIILCLPRLVDDFLRLQGTVEVVYPLSVPIAFLCVAALSVDIPRVQRVWAQQADEFSLIEILAQKMNASFNLESSLHEVLLGMVAMTGADRGFIAAGGLPGKEFRILTSTGYDAEQSVLEPDDVLEYFKAHLLNKRVSVCRQPLTGSRPASCLAVVITAGDEDHGFIFLETDERKNAFSNSDVFFVKRLSAHLATALEKESLYLAVLEKAAETGVLLNMAKYVSSSLDIDTTLKMLAEKLVLYLQVTFCKIYIFKGGNRLHEMASFHVVKGHQRCAAEGIPLDDLPALKNIVKSGSVKVFSRKDSILPGQEALPDKSELERCGLKENQPLIVFPLRSKDQDLGLIIVGERRNPERAPITEAKVNFCGALASQAAVAVENALMHSVIRSRQEYLDTVFNSINDVVFTVDTEKKVRYMNPAAEAFFQMEFKEVAGKDCGVLNQQFVEGCTLRKGANGEFTRVDSQNETWLIGGRRVPVTYNFAPLLGQMDNVIGAVCLVHDRTEEERLDKMKSDFVSLVSHEMRSPLAGMKVALEVLLEDDTYDETKRKLVGSAHNQVERLAGFVEDILNVNVIQSGKLKLNPEVLSVKPLVEGCINRMREKWQEHKFYGVFEPESVFIYADQKGVTIIVDNLLDNAAKYSSPGSEVRIRAKKLDSGSFKFEVTDQGGGISVEDRSKVFERFFRADTKNSNGGHGLGLYIVKSFVEAHGGKIWISSTSAGGTTFCFTLPSSKELLQDLDCAE